MATLTKKTSIGTTRTKAPKVENTKQLSKAAIWRLNNPGGIIIVHDRRAVNR